MSEAKIRRWRWGLSILALSMAAHGCNVTQEGEPPPGRELNFPVAAELLGAPGSPASHLVVASSNFDLRFNAGSLMSLDLTVLRTILEDGGCQEESCDFPDFFGPAGEELIADEVAIGSHTSDTALSSAGDRIYLAARSELALAYVGVGADGTFECGREQADGETLGRCADAFRRLGTDPSTSERELVLAGDPVAVSVGQLEDVGGEEGDGDFILLALRDGRVGLFLDDGGAPSLVHIVRTTSDNLVTLTQQPETGLAWLPSASSDEISRVGMVLDPVRSRSFLYDAGAVRVGGIDDGEDLRHILFDPDAPTAYVLSRRPEAVVAVALDRAGLTSIDLGLRDVWEVGQGPSRLAMANVVIDEASGATRRYILASCFNAQKIFIIDPVAGALVSVVGGLSGPFEMVVDEADGTLYLVDFATSVIRVIDLGPLAINETPRLVATLGRPFAPSGL